MPRLPSSVPTDVELHILGALWKAGPSTVRQIHEALQGDRPDTGYSTTLKMVQVMTAKGLLKKDDSQRPQVFEPVQQEEQTQVALIDNLIQRGFGGSASKLVMRALAAQRVSAEELARIRSLLSDGKGDRS